MLLAFLVVASHHHHFLTYTIATHTRHSQDRKKWVFGYPYNQISMVTGSRIIWLYIAVYCQLSSNIQISMDKPAVISYHIITALHNNALPASIDSKALGTLYEDWSLQPYYVQQHQLTHLVSHNTLFFYFYFFNYTYYIYNVFQ